MGLPGSLFFHQWKLAAEKKAETLIGYPICPTERKTKTWTYTLFCSNLFWKV
jgi:hypothetical protein